MPHLAHPSWNLIGFRRRIRLKLFEIQSDPNGPKWKRFIWRNEGLREMGNKMLKEEKQCRDWEISTAPLINLLSIIVTDLFSGLFTAWNRLVLVALSLIANFNPHNAVQTVTHTKNFYLHQMARRRSIRCMGINKSPDLPSGSSDTV